MDRPRVLCMCGMDLGYLVADFLLETGVKSVFVVNDGEESGKWYRTPRQLDITEIQEKEAVSWQPDLIITAFYHRLLRAELYERPRLGAWNIHLGDAERYRGAYPSIRALIQGDADYAVTLHRIDSGIDTGDILEKLRFPIPAGFNGRDLYNLMVEKGAELFRRRWNDLLTGNAPRLTRPQNGQNAQIMYRKDLSHQVHPAPDFIRHVQALTFPPFPPPWFTAGGKRYVVIEDSEETD